MTFPPASVDRLLHIAAFAVSGYSGTAGRTTKPFNPLLGETFEFVCQEKVRIPKQRCHCEHLLLQIAAMVSAEHAQQKFRAAGRE